jgi:phage FluMu protein Com
MSIKAATAILNASLDVECPYCDKDINFFDHDEDGIYTRPIFNNKWDDLKGMDVTCPHCDSEFVLDDVEF